MSEKNERFYELRPLTVKPVEPRLRLDKEWDQLIRKLARSLYLRDKRKFGL